MAESNYVDSYVAFIDILGFKNFVNNTAYSTLDSFYKMAIVFATHIPKTTHSLYAKDATSSVTVNIVSDSIVISIPKSADHSLEILLNIANMISFAFLSDYDVLCRGGIAGGKFYANDKVAFGPGLVNAYSLEQQAVYPRIIFTKETFDEYSKMCNYTFLEEFEKMYMQDTADQLYICDYIRYFIERGKISTSNEKKVISCLTRIKSFIESNIHKQTDDRVVAKYLWFMKYYNDRVKSFLADKGDLLIECDSITV